MYHDFRLEKFLVSPIEDGWIFQIQASDLKSKEKKISFKSHLSSLQVQYDFS